MIVVLLFFFLGVGGQVAVDDVCDDRLSQYTDCARSPFAIDHLSCDSPGNCGIVEECYNEYLSAAECYLSVECGSNFHCTTFGLALGSTQCPSDWQTCQNVADFWCCEENCGDTYMECDDTDKKKKKGHDWVVLGIIVIVILFLVYAILRCLLCPCRSLCK